MQQVSSVPKIDRNYALIGGVSGLAVCMFLQPLEVIKMGIIINPTRSMKIQSSSFLRGFYQCAKLIGVTEGIKGFWRGLAPSLIRSSLGSSSYFLLLTQLEEISHLKHHKLSNKDHFLNSAFSRMLATLIINPIAVVGSRFEVPFIRPYNNMFSAFHQIYKYQGMNAFLKGSYTCMIKEGMFGGVYYMIYNNIKNIINRFQTY